MSKSAKPVKILRSKYIKGCVVGTILGYGIGHAMQGRWKKDKGWVFTIGRGTLIFVTAGLSSGLALRDIYYQQFDKLTGKPLTLALIALGISLAFKIWEVVDIWLIDKNKYTIIKPQKQSKP